MVINTDTKRRIRLKELEEEELLKQKQELEERKNRNFVMFYREYMQETMWLSKKSGVASAILLFIIEHMDQYNSLICSYTLIQESLGVSKDSVRLAIKLLKDNGFIDVLKSGTSNIYIINPQIAWSSWENNKKYCKFNGNVLIAQSENKNFNSSAQFEKLKTLKTRENIKPFNFIKISPNE
jgi:DNA-binding transcriptional ArsR family regulator